LEAKTDYVYLFITSYTDTNTHKSDEKSIPEPLQTREKQSTIDVFQHSQNTSESSVCPSLCVKRELKRH